MGGNDPGERRRHRHRLGLFVSRPQQKDVPLSFSPSLPLSRSFSLSLTHSPSVSLLLLDFLVGGLQEGTFHFSVAQ